MRPLSNLQSLKDWQEPQVAMSQQQLQEVLLRQIDTVVPRVSGRVKTRTESDDYVQIVRVDDGGGEILEPRRTIIGMGIKQAVMPEYDHSSGSTYDSQRVASYMDNGDVRTELTTLGSIFYEMPCVMALAVCWGMPSR